MYKMIPWGTDRKYLTCTETIHALAPHSVRQKIMMISLDLRKSHSDIKNSKEDH